MISDHLVTLSPVHMYCPVCEEKFQWLGGNLHSHNAKKPYWHTCGRAKMFGIYTYRDTLSNSFEISLNVIFFKAGEICPRMRYSRGFCKSNFVMQSGEAPSLEFLFHMRLAFGTKISCANCFVKEQCDLAENFKAEIQNCSEGEKEELDLKFKLTFDEHEVQEVYEKWKSEFDATIGR